MKNTADTKVRFGTIIMSCACSHSAQDKLYGKNKRLHNLAKKGSHARCTVCSKLTAIL